MIDFRVQTFHGNLKASEGPLSVACSYSDAKTVSKIENRSFDHSQIINSAKRINHFRLFKVFLLICLI